MNILVSLFWGIALLSFVACTEEIGDNMEMEPEEQESHEHPDTLSSEDTMIQEIIFGTFYGFCQGETCIEIYKLDEQGRLYEDELDTYELDTFVFKLMSNQNVESVSDIWSHVPPQLLDHDNTVIGCPDCYDQGGIYIQFVDNGEVRKWRIDADKDNLPSYLHDLVDYIHDGLAVINQE